MTPGHSEGRPPRRSVLGPDGSSAPPPAERTGATSGQNPSLSKQGEDQGLYRDALRILESSGHPYLVGGAFALRHYTGIERDTRDFDVFVLPDHVLQLLDRFSAEGYPTELVFPHWLGKVRRGERYVDIIFSSGNGVARVDDAWFEHAVPSEVLGRPVMLCPIEEMIWSKAFIMERERFDGADVAHMVHSCAETMDWDRLLARFQPHPRVLLVHLILFGFVYPHDRGRIPERVMAALLSRLDEPAPAGPVTMGTLLSRAQYLPDLACGYRDARLEPDGTMSAEDVATWTEAAIKEQTAPRVTGDPACSPGAPDDPEPPRRA